MVFDWSVSLSAAGFSPLKKRREREDDDKENENDEISFQKRQKTELEGGGVSRVEKGESAKAGGVDPVEEGSSSPSSRAFCSSVEAAATTFSVPDITIDNAVIDPKEYLFQAPSVSSEFEPIDFDAMERLLLPEKSFLDDLNDPAFRKQYPLVPAKGKEEGAARPLSLFVLFSL